MQNRLSVNSPSRARIAVFVLVLLSLISLAVFALMPTSRATLNPAKANAGNVKATNQKRNQREFVPGEILVRYRSEKLARRQPRVTMVHSTERAIAVHVEQFEGSDIVEGLRMGRVAPQDTMQAIAALRSQPDVLYAEPNYIRHKDSLPNDPRFPDMYGLKNIGQTGGTPGADIDAEQAWEITTGSRAIVVGVIDEGIDINHPDLEDNIWTNPGETAGNGLDDDGNGFIDDINGWDFFHDDNSVFDGAADPNNQTDAHGTHVAGTIGAVGDNSIGVVGVNWQVSLMSLKFLGPGGGSDSNAIRAINYARNMRDTWIATDGAQGANVRVLNNSYGGDAFSQALLDAIKAAGNSDILFVAAAGNNSSDNDLLPHYPSNFDAPNLVAVAATDALDNLSGFSNFGVDTVHIAAPGSAILSTTPNNTYSTFSGTSMATPHVSGGAALIGAANPNITLQQLRALLIFNGDIDPFLAGKTLMERRLSVAGSLQAQAENDTTTPGSVNGLHIVSQSGRSLSLAWTASGDDGEVGQASLYQVSFTDAETGATIPLENIVPPASGSPQTLDIKTPYRHTDGVITLREFDNAGNEGISESLPVSVTSLVADPYATSLGAPEALSEGGTALELNFDDRYQENYALPFSFPFFGQSYSSVTISTNGNLYFSPPPKLFNGDADDFLSSTEGLAKFKMIAGLWDDLDLRTIYRADADVYVVQPDANRIIFRWQGVPCSYQGSGCIGGAPVNFEIELKSNGDIQTRYGSGNANLFPVVGISGGEPDAYVIPSHTSPALVVNLTNAQTVTFASRAAHQPAVDSLSPASAIAGGSEFTLTVNGSNFDSSSIVRFAGTDRSTALVSANQLIATILAEDIALAGSYPITVINPGPAGGISLTSNFVVNNPVPTISLISPAFFVPPPYCGNGFTLTVNGTNFVGGSIIRLNGIDLSTNLLSSTQLTAQITEADIQTGGFHFSITVQNPAPGGGISDSADLFMNGPESTITSFDPDIVFAGSGPLTLIVNGHNFSCTAQVLFNGSSRPTTYVSETKLTAQLTAADVQAAGTFPIRVLKPDPGGAISNPVNFLVIRPPVEVFSISPNSAVAGGPGFTLTVIGNNFFDGIVVRWNGSDRPTTVISGTQLTATITADDIQTPGQAAVTIFSPDGGIFPTLTFTVTSPSGYEADVAPRPNGSNTGIIGISDWVQAGRFVAGLDTPNPGSEFQRADCAPRDTLGNGNITISDWVQAGRYASALDPVTAAGGPTEPPGQTAPGTTQFAAESLGIRGTNGAEASSLKATRINLAGTVLAGQGSTVSIEFDAQGNENALGFSLMFDPAKLSFISAVKSDDAATATLNVNHLNAARGRIGIALALPGGSAFSSGRHQLVMLTFALRSDSSELPAISFADLPIAREVVDLNANRLTAVFHDRSDGDPLAGAQFFVSQHYLDFLGRIPDSDGLDYWTQRINECGTDRLCISQRRIDVSAAFFVEPELQQTGSFVYRLYKAGLGRQLTYAEFAARGRIISGPNLNQSKAAFADAFVGRADFVQKYQQHQTAAAFIDLLLEQVHESSQVDLSLRRSELIALYQAGGNTNQSRSRVLRAVIEDASYIQAEYNPSFVLMEYFGYLRRDPDKGGYDFWLNVLNNRDPGNYRGMVCSFITSTEYQKRFSQVVSHSNADCSY